MNSEKSLWIEEIAKLQKQNDQLVRELENTSRFQDTSMNNFARNQFNDAIPEKSPSSAFSEKSAQKDCVYRIDPPTKTNIESGCLEYGISLSNDLSSQKTNIRGGYFSPNKSLVSRSVDLQALESVESVSQNAFPSLSANTSSNLLIQVDSTQRNQSTQKDDSLSHLRDELNQVKSRFAELSVRYSAILDHSKKVRIWIHLG